MSIATCVNNSSSKLQSDLEYKHLIPKDFTLVKRNNGFIQKLGKSAGIESNWYYDALDSNGNNCVLMFCRPGGFTIIDTNIMSTISIINDKYVTWFIMQNGYIAGHIHVENKMKNIYLHQYLINHRGHGQGQDSVDHINRNKLDNQPHNLNKMKIQENEQENIMRKNYLKELNKTICQSLLYIIKRNEERHLESSLQLKNILSKIKKNNI